MPAAGSRMTSADTALLTKAYMDHPKPRRGETTALSASRRRGLSSQHKPAPRPAKMHQTKMHQTTMAGHSWCYCPQCLVASPGAGRVLVGKRRDFHGHGPSPYLEDLTKTLMTSQPARRKPQLHLVPQRRSPMTVSPYERLRETKPSQRLRVQLQAELVERQLQRLWDQEAAAAAEHCGVDVGTYATLLELQHRDITPEDYDTLQALDSGNKPKTLTQAILDAKFPAWYVPEAGSTLPMPGDGQRPAAARRLEDVMGDEGSVSACGEAQTPDASSTSVETGIEGSISEAPDGTGGSADAAKEAIADSGVGESTTERAKECTAPSVWDADRTCSICLEKFVVGQLARSLPCSHIFHAECIDSWLTQSSRACPEDNIPVLAEEEMAKIDATNAESRQEQQSHEPAYALSYLTSDFATGLQI